MSNASAIYNKNLLDSFVDSLIKDPDIEYALVVDHSDGRILAHSDHLWDGRIFEPAKALSRKQSEETGRPNPGVERITSPITIDHKAYGTLVVGYSAAHGRGGGSQFPS